MVRHGGWELQSLGIEGRTALGADRHPSQNGYPEVTLDHDDDGPTVPRSIDGAAAGDQGGTVRSSEPGCLRGW